jgi:hypothetical protein
MIGAVIPDHYYSPTGAPSIMSDPRPTTSDSSDPSFAAYLRSEAAKYRLVGTKHASRLASVLEGLELLSEACREDWGTAVTVETAGVRVKVEAR